MPVIRFLLILTIMLTTVSPALANPLAAIWQDFNKSYHRNRCWPHPFIEADNMAVRAPFATMIHNGWRLQNIISSYHFERDSSIVNESGRRHIHWVLTQAPMNRRTIYIERGVTERETASRYEAVRRVAEQYAAKGQPVDVQISHVTARGWPADYADAVNSKFHESTPEPRLPTDSTGFESQ